MCKPVRAFLLICSVAYCFTASAQVNKFRNQAITLKRVIERQHYSPRPVDDKFSASLFDELIDRLDADKLFFTADDIKQLSTYRLQLDDELNGKQWAFLDKLMLLYKQRLKKADSTVHQILQKPLDLNLAEKYSSHQDSSMFATSEQQLKTKWQRWLKLGTLSYLSDICQIKKGDAKTCLQYEPQAREKMKAAELRSIKKLLEHPSGYENYVASLYLDLVASSFDPHTNYMPPAEKQLFQSHLGTEGLYFGISVVENEKGEIILGQLMPGSPAWRSGELNQGDVLVQLKWQNKEPISLEGATAQEVSAILEQSNTDRLEMTVRKTDGMIKTVSLVKEKIRNDDNAVKGFMLKGSRNIGYIYLPGFYTSFEGEASSCANDVAKEIVNLKKENIQGLILDVRYNGGGSLQEALDMAGIFIDEGPLALIKDRAGKTVTLKDMNRGTIYDGPLLLLINGQSASASELLAAVLQDYNRAIITGSNTYGKGTAQIIDLVDTNRNARTVSNNEQPEFGFVKVTIQKFFRVNGTTTQHQGVKPDISLPDVYAELNYTEAASPNSLPADTVARNKYYKPLTALPLSTLKAKSAARVESNAGFEEIKKMAKQLKHEQEPGPKTISLKWSEYYASILKDAPDQQALLKKLQELKPGYTVENTALDKEKLKTDVYAGEMNTRWKDRLLKDIYVHEAFNILSDFIGQ